MSMIVVVRMVVAVAIVRVTTGFLGLFVHRFDSNRDLGWLTAWNRAVSVENNGAARGDRQE
jgi:hypothetical protein